MSSSTQYWLLIFSCYVLCAPHYTHSTPLARQQTRAQTQPHTARVQQERDKHRALPCAHESIAELIRKSPVILKALGARIFTDADLSVLQPDSSINNNYSNSDKNNAGQQESQNEQRNFLTLSPTAAISTTTTERHSKNAADATTLTNRARTDSILMTLTPETIYKGASLLKMTPSGESASRSRNSANTNSAESTYLYDGQLNATLQPLACFDNNILKVLPTVLIAFGKLVTAQQQQQQQQQQQELHLDKQTAEQKQQSQHATDQTDMLHISINGLHRWTPQFENHIWKHLGWDDWSDFTLCSVTCGKGVQQRFRRCLLDNPMMNLNMNMQLSALEDDVDVDVDSNDDDDGADLDVNADVDGEEHVADDFVGDYDKQAVVVVPADSTNGVKLQKSYATQQPPATVTTTAATIKAQSINEEISSDMHMLLPKSNLDRTTIKETWPQQQQQWAPTATISVNDMLQADAVVLAAAEDETMRIFAADSNNYIGSDESDTATTAPTTTTSSVTATASTTTISSNNKSKHRKRRKSNKSFSTMFCEGYNIEQRNCNTFECSDDITDLLKFYKKYSTLEEANAATSSVPTLTVTPAVGAVGAVPKATIDFSASTAAMAGDATATTTANAAPTSTPANMGYVRSWRNFLNFTLMITVRIKNESKTTATIFSIRNATHNLYLEPSRDGLRLYLERDNTTEMLPVKFNLFDYRWHQVAISIQNGDFISIYVDCSWTNSFVVSKRLFSLPLDADVEIGRGFNGELQQLLVLPNNQERQQCSSKRTSINEVKRYIIDTFIDDYGN